MCDKIRCNKTLEHQRIVSPIIKLGVASQRQSISRSARSRNFCVLMLCHLVQLAASSTETAMFLNHGKYKMSDLGNEYRYTAKWAPAGKTRHDSTCQMKGIRWMVNDGGWHHGVIINVIGDNLQIKYFPKDEAEPKVNTFRKSATWIKPSFMKMSWTDRLDRSSHTNQRYKLGMDVEVMVRDEFGDKQWLHGTVVEHVGQDKVKVEYRAGLNDIFSVSKLEVRNLEKKSKDPKSEKTLNHRMPSPVSSGLHGKAKRVPKHEMSDTTYKSKITTESMFNEEYYSPEYRDYNSMAWTPTTVPEYSSSGDLRTLLYNPGTLVVVREKETWHRAVIVEVKKADPKIFHVLYEIKQDSDYLVKIEIFQRSSPGPNFEAGWEERFPTFAEFW